MPLQCTQEGRRRKPRSRSNIRGPKRPKIRAPGAKQIRRPHCFLVHGRWCCSDRVESRSRAEKRACFAVWVLFDSVLVQIRAQTAPGGTAIRVVAVLMLGLWVGLVALATFPQLHRLLHADSSQPSHECLVTQLAKSQLLTAAGVIAVAVAAFVFFGLPSLAERSALPVADVCLAPPRGPPSPSFLP